jgi:ribosomal protein S21
MAKVTVQGGNVEKALRVFTRQCKRERIFQECRERRHYTKPSVKRRQQAIKKKRTTAEEKMK